MRPWRDWPLMAKGLVLVSLPVALMLASLASGWRLGAQAAEAEAEARRTLQAQSDIQALHKLIAEAATGVRGYLLTGRDDFLTPYWKAESDLAPTVARLDARIRDAGQRERLARIRPLLTRKFESLDEMRTTGRQQSPEALREHLIASKAILDELRSELEQLQTREAELVEQRSAAVTAALRLNLAMTLVSVIAAFVVAAAVVALFYTGIGSRVRRLAGNAERLLHGEPLDHLPAATDELGQLTERLQRASTLLAERAAESVSANRAKTDFLSRISHELRTPLNAILGFAQLLDADARDGPARRGIQQILGAGRHLLGLINDLLDISRIEAGQLRLTREPVALAALLADAHALTEALTHARGMRLSFDGVPDTLAVVGDRQRILQILLNLLSNAVKFNSPAGEVRVRVTTTPDAVEVAVQDDGQGIDEVAQARLFQPFERLDASTEGSGLGLAIAQQLARSMDGDIHVRSARGAGSTFTLRLPRAAAPSPAPLVDAARARATVDATDAPAAAPVGTRTALAIEDNASNRALIEALVARRAGWNVVFATTAAQGLRLTEQHRPSLVLLDLQLPDGNGLALLPELRARGANRVVVLTADALPDTRTAALAAGADDFLTKPIDVRHFVNVLENRHS
jgi:signal transduction histidine kinase